MGRNNAHQWHRLQYLLKGYDEFCPREVKARAMALCVLGYSTRQIERELRLVFPGEDTPTFSTIARWQRSQPDDLRAAQWSGVAARASQLVLDRFHEVRRMPFNKMLKASMMASDMAYKNIERRQRLANKKWH